MSDASPLPRCWSAGWNQFQYPIGLARARLLGVRDQESVALGQLVHAGAGGEVIGVLRTPVQHDDQRGGLTGVPGRHVQLVGALARPRWRTRGRGTGPGLDRPGTRLRHGRGHVRRNPWGSRDNKSLHAGHAAAVARALLEQGCSPRRSGLARQPGRFEHSGQSMLDSSGSFLGLVVAGAFDALRRCAMRAPPSPRRWRGTRPVPRPRQSSAARVPGRRRRRWWPDRVRESAPSARPCAAPPVARG